MPTPEIDAAFLDALPEDLRAEVLASHVMAAGGAPAAPGIEMSVLAELVRVNLCVCVRACE